MVFKDTMKDGVKGRCVGCEFFHEDQCKRMERALSSMTDPICLQKCTVMLLNNIGQMLYDYMSEEDEPEIN